jgi:hypothetical protein
MRHQLAQSGKTFNPASHHIMAGRHNLAQDMRFVARASLNFTTDAHEYHIFK